MSISMMTCWVRRMRRRLGSSRTWVACLRVPGRASLVLPLKMAAWVLPNPRTRTCGRLSARGAWLRWGAANSSEEEKRVIFLRQQAFGFTRLVFLFVPPTQPIRDGVGCSGAHAAEPVTHV